MYCSKCKKEIPDNSKNCEYCGASLNGSKVKVVTNENVKTIPLVLVIFIIIVAICVVYFGYKYYFLKKIQNTESNTDINSNISKSSEVIKEENNVERISMYNVGSYVNKSFSLDSNSYDTDSPYFKVLNIYQIQTEIYDDLLFRCVISTNGRRYR